MQQDKSGYRMMDWEENEKNTSCGLGSNSFRLTPNLVFKVSMQSFVDPPSRIPYFTNVLKCLGGNGNFSMLQS